MKTLRLNMLSLFFLMVGGIAVFGQQDRLEVPGDYFSLEGALELFKKSASPEEFERLLNSPHSKVNNLDLNGDGQIDYIRVINRNQGNVNIFILQAVVSPTEAQDVAVISLEKLANGKAVLQITGDADVYGVETIIEPTEEVRVYAGTTTARSVVNVWTWPAVQYVYSPYYVVWVSPWNWYRRPVWWSPWRPVVYYDYYSWWNPYRVYYTRCYTSRIVYAHGIYRPYRTTSVVVYNRHHTQITHYRSVHRDNHNRQSANGNNRSSRSSYTDNRPGRSEYTNDRPTRNQYNGRSNDAQGSRGNSTNRVTETRQRLTSPVGPENSRSSVNTRNQMPDKTYADRRLVMQDKPASAGRSEFQSKPNVPQRNTAVQPRNGRPVNKPGAANLNPNSQQREIRPAVKPERGRSGESPGMNRQGALGNRKRSE